MLHLGMPHLTGLASPLNLAAMALLAVALWRAVAGPAPEEPVRTRVLMPVTCLAAVGWLGTPTAVLFAHRYAHVATFAYIGCVIAWCWMLRTKKTDDDTNSGGGDQPLRPDAPEDPGGGGIDWDEFESAFWSHVRDRDLTPV